jgi:hypothetical protein
LGGFRLSNTAKIEVIVFEDGELVGQTNLNSRLKSKAEKWQRTKLQARSVTRSPKVKTLFQYRSRKRQWSLQQTTVVCGLVSTHSNF